MSLSTDSGTGAVTVHQEGGSQVVFALSGATYLAAPRVIATLSKNADGTFLFTRRATEFFGFDTSGRLISETDLNGYATTLDYSSPSKVVVTDSERRTLTLTLDPSGSHITAITDSGTTPRTVHFSYDASGNLADVIDVNSGDEQFTYDPSTHRLLTMREPKYINDHTTVPTPVVTNHYDSAGRVDYQIDQVGRTTRFDYTTVPGSTEITDPKGNVTQDDFQYGELTSMTRGYGTPQAAKWVYTYDQATAGLASTLDPNTHLSSATYDNSGNRLSFKDALGRQTLATYNRFNEPLTIEDPNLVTMTMQYDAQGNLISRSRPLLDINKVTVATQTTRYNYLEAGDVNKGEVTSMVDPNNKTWRFGYDPYGLRASVTDPRGDQATTAYNNVGWRVSSVAPKGNVANCGCTTQYTTLYGYTEKTGSVNQFGDVTTVTAPPTGTQPHVTTRYHDANRNVVEVLDADGNDTNNQYDAANEQIEVDRAGSPPTKLVTDYWPDGTIKDQVDGNLKVTSYGYDPLARVTSVTDPLRTTSTTYDGVGNRLTAVDAQSPAQTTSYGYDLADQLTSVQYSDNVTPNISSITYNGVGQRTTMTDGTGKSLWSYDSLNRITSSTDGSGSMVGYGYTYGSPTAYDLTGQVRSITYPGGGLQVLRGYDDAGRLSSVTDWLGHTTVINHDQDSKLSTQVYPNNTTETLTPDNADGTASISHAPSSTPQSPFASVGYTRDGNQQIQQTASATLPDNHMYLYTPLNQIGSVDAATYGYDAADNLTGVAGGNFQTYNPGNELTGGGLISAVGSGSGGGIAAASPLTVSFSAPAVVKDQILVAVTAAGGTALTAPAGYTLADTVNVGGAETLLYRRTAAGGETSVAVTAPLGSSFAVVAALYRGVDPAVPFETAFSHGSGTGSATAAAVTSTLNGDRLIFLGGESGGMTGGSWSVPSMSPQAQFSQSTVSASGILAAQTLPLSGSTGTRTGTFSGGNAVVGDLVALRPAQTAYGYDLRGNRTSVTPPGGTTTHLSYDQADRLTGYGASATYAYRGDGLRMSKNVGGVTTRFAWDQSSGLPLMIADGTNRYVYGEGGKVIEQVAIAPPPIVPVGAPATAGDSGTATSLSMPLPTGLLPNDQIIVATTFSKGATNNSVTTPAGYSALGSPLQSAGGIPDLTSVFRRTAQPGDTSVTITYSGPFAKNALVTVYRGADPISPIDIMSTGSASGASSVTTASATTHYDGETALVIQGAAYTGVPPQSWTAPATYTERGQRGDAAGVAIGVADSGALTAGSTGVATSGFSTSGELTSMLLTLKTPPTILYYHQDDLGSTRALTDAVGNVAQTSSFDSYGNPAAVLSAETAATPLGFAGEYRDAESGLIYLRARMYDPATGQFISRDPATATTRSPYGYTSNNPLNGTDPSGLYEYTTEWGLGNWGDYMPEMAMQLMLSDPNSVFPFLVEGENGNSHLVRNGRYLLHTNLPIGNCSNIMMVELGCSTLDPVEVSDVCPTSFTFTALPGHSEGGGGTINFSIFRQGGQLVLRQHAQGPDSWAHFLFGGVIDAIRFQFAQSFWSQQAQNLARRMGG